MRFRDFLEVLRANGELKSVDLKTHWSLEAAALCAASNRAGGPALHFTEVTGYPDSSLVGGMFAGPGTLYPHPEGRTPWTRLSLALGLKRNTEYEELMDELLRRCGRAISPIRLRGGACKEEIHYGEEADLLEFPLPLHYYRDGGRYLSAGLVIAADPEGRWTNWGVYRCFVRGHRELVINAGPGTHLGSLFRQCTEKGVPLPCCVVLGGNVAGFIAAAFPQPWGEAEAGLAGGLWGEPLELVQAETNNLLVPADAEVVIEGEIQPGAEAPEGPFPEYARYAPAAPRPLLQVKAITHRRQPVIPFVAEGVKVSDSMALRSVLISFYLWREVREKTQLRVRWINLPVEANLSVCVVAAYPYYRGHNFWLANFLLQRKDRCCFDKVLLVDAEINPVDLYEVMNDWAQKTAPFKGRGYHAEEYPHLASPTAAYPPEGDDGTPSIVWDACWPDTWSAEEVRGRVSFETSFPPEVQQRVLEVWPELGFSVPPQTKKVAKEWTRCPLPG